jgi:hypothetical protein
MSPENEDSTEQQPNQRPAGNKLRYECDFLGERVERLLDYLDEMVRASSFTQ